MEEAVDMAVDNVFDRAVGFVRDMREGALREVPRDQMQETFTCAACRGTFSYEQMEMTHRDNGFGMCPKCFRSAWEALREKLKRGAKNVAQQAASASGRHRRPRPDAAPAPQPPGKPPWTVLGITQDASVQEIRKAYRGLAMQWHPDKIPAGSPSMLKEQARVMFEEITRARDVMLKVRNPPT